MNKICAVFHNAHLSA